MGNWLDKVIKVELLTLFRKNHLKSFRILGGYSLIICFYAWINSTLS